MAIIMRVCIMAFMRGSFIGIVCGVCVVSSGFIVDVCMVDVCVVDVPLITRMCIRVMSIGIMMRMSIRDDVHVLLLCTPMRKVCWRQDVAFVLPSSPIKVPGAIGCVL
jgi:hypothetical protein